MSKPFCGGVPFDSLQTGDFVVVEINGEPRDGEFRGFEVCHDQWCFVLHPSSTSSFIREWLIPTRDITYVMRPNQSQPFHPGDLHVGRVVIERCFRGDAKTVR
jgi:hypothetical protein